MEIFENCASKNTIKKVKKQLTEKEKTFPKSTADKKLVYNILIYTFTYSLLIFLEIFINNHTGISKLTFHKACTFI